jgi:hypothetical protein
MDGDECVAAEGVKIAMRKGKTRRKPAQVSLCPPQIPRNLTRARTRAAGRLTATNLITYVTYCLAVKPQGSLLMPSPS